MDVRPAFVTLPGHLLDAIAELRRRFQKGADEFPNLTVHYAERPCDELEEFIPEWPSPSPAGPFGYGSEIAYMGNADYAMSYEGHENLVAEKFYKTPAQKPQYTFVFRGDRPDGPNPDGSWTLHISPKEKPGATLFMEIARQAAGLLRKVRPLVPLVPSLVRLIDNFHEVYPVQDESGKVVECKRGQVMLPIDMEQNDPRSWVRYLLMLGWADETDKVQRWTWKRGERNGKSEMSLHERPESRECLASCGHWIEDPPVRFTCKLPGVFGASVGALTYLANHATRIPPARGAVRAPSVPSAVSSPAPSEADDVPEAQVRPAIPSPSVPTGERQAETATESLNPGARAIAAAYQLRREGKPVSVRMACKLAKVDRKHLAEKYPEAVATIRALGHTDRRPPQAEPDARTGRLDARADDLEGSDDEE
jgi:hypothetical protein